MKRIIECVPNFSEGKRIEIIKAIGDAISSVPDSYLLHTDPGHDTNRTVYTFAGEPDAVVEAAFLAAQKASELIDMRNHKGMHPRIGALDVCPFIPISGISMDEVVAYARLFGKRLGDELDIPVYCYENSAYTELRRDLANCRKGEYEGLKSKLEDAEWKPDFGPVKINLKMGASIVGAREILIAYNVNLNTKSIEIAREIASDIRETGRKVSVQEHTNIVPGLLKSVKAIGWYIDQYGCAQVSMNLTNYNITPIHVAYEEVKKKAEFYGLKVTGSELIGLVPLKTMLDAGLYYLAKQNISINLPESEIINIAVESLGLNENRPFMPNERIIEYVIDEKINRGNSSIHLA